MRDFQRKRVYDSERDLHPDFEIGERLQTVPEIEEWVGGIFHSRWYKNRWPQMHAIVVKDGRGRKRAGGSATRKSGVITGCIRHPIWTRTQGLVLHEFAHATIFAVELAETGCAARIYSHHGSEFCSVLLKLYGRWLGKEYANELRQAFRKHKVKYIWRQA